MNKCRGFGDSERDISSNSNFYCSKCKIYTPLRASHCNSCKYCIKRRDHHCPLLGICIDQMNHKTYIKFIFSELCLDLQIFVYALHPALIDCPFRIWFITSFQSALISGISLFYIIQLLMILRRQMKNILSNKTIWENERSDRITYLKNWSYQQSPFSKGYTNNLKEFITMDKIEPNYFIPETREEIQEWKNNNHISS